MSCILPEGGHGLVSGIDMQKLDNNPQLREEYLKQIVLRVETMNTKKALNSLNVSPYIDSKKLGKTLQQKFRKIKSGLDSQKLQGVRFKAKSTSRKDPAIGSGDTIWSNEWDKIANYGPVPIKHLVILIQFFKKKLILTI